MAEEKLLIASTENGSVYVIDHRTYSIVNHLTCPSIVHDFCADFPYFYNVRNKRIFAACEDHSVKEFVLNWYLFNYKNI